MDVVSDSEEVIRIFKQYGYKLSLDQAEEIWSTYCTQIYFASWLPIVVSDYEFKVVLLPIALEIIQND